MSVFGLPLFRPIDDAIPFNELVARIVADGAKALCILASTEDGWTAETVNPTLKALSIPVFGGCFPKLIFQGSVESSGTIFLPLLVDVDISIIHELSSHASQIEQSLLDCHHHIGHTKDLIVMFDGLSKNVDRLSEALYNLMGGNGSKCIGGGCGALDFKQAPCVFSNEGLLENAAVLASIEPAMELGVGHGWEILEGPFLVTRANKNRVMELNFRPALDVYKKELAQHTKLSFDHNDFFSISKTFPLGIETLDGSILVRDPVGTDNTNLVCVGEVPENTTVYILKGNKINLIQSSASAADSAMQQYRQHYSDTERVQGLLFDCISRILFLEEAYEEELSQLGRALGERNVLIGALSLGELATSKYGPIQLLNKSTALAVL